MARKRIKRVHVNMHVIRKNTKEGTEDPPITVKVGKENHRCSEAEILGPSKLIYSPHKQLLDCGARLVLTTTADIALDGGKVVT
ncbi:hypothetical protein [uncultured Mediterranean phage]|nr:hypothetical protein [uncultured Mediterranean phage]